MKLRAILLSSFMLICNVVFAENWIIAASAFSIEDSLSLTDATRASVETVATQLPSLILESLQTGVNRTVYPEEKLAREIYTAKKEQQTAYTNYTNQIKTRDALLLKYSGTELKQKISDAEEQIQKAKEKIIEVEKNEKEILTKFEKTKNKQNVLESVTVYQNDSSKLFATKTETDSLIAKTNQLVAASVRGLLTGKISVFDEYIKVDCELTTYPDSKLVKKVSEIGTLSDIEYISRSILRSLMPTIVNDKLVKTDISILPLEAAENATIYVEDSVYRGSNPDIAFTAGKHVIRIESPGYENVTYTLDYKAGSTVLVNVDMKKVVTLEAFFSVTNKDKKIENQSISDLYLNALYVGATPLNIKITNDYYMGEVVSSKNVSEFFVLSNNPSLNNTEKNIQGSINFKEPKKDLADVIDKSRKRMYWSYGGLICTVPFYFYCKGMYEVCENNMDIVDSSMMSQWSMYSDISMYTMIGAGANFLVQLIIYLVDANRVIPKIIDVDYSQQQNINLNENKKTENETIKDGTTENENIEDNVSESTEQILGDNPIQIPVDDFVTE